MKIINFTNIFMNRFLRITLLIIGGAPQIGLDREPLVDLLEQWDDENQEMAKNLCC